MENRPLPEIIFHDITGEISRDQRGWVANPLMLPHFPRQFGHLHLVSMEPGAVRGNHYHRTLKEWLFAFGNQYSFLWKVKGKISQRFIPADKMVVIEIPPGITHTIRNESNEIIYLLAYQNGGREGIKSDTITDPIIE